MHLVVLAFSFNDTATTEIYTLSLHDALPISRGVRARVGDGDGHRLAAERERRAVRVRGSEEHTSELQSLRHLVCRLLLEKKKNKYKRKVVTIKQQVLVNASEHEHCRDMCHRC